MRTVLENGLVMIEASDWRYSASIVGLYRCLQIVSPEYDLKQFDNKDYIIYDPSIITKENYIRCLKAFYGDDFRILRYKTLLSKDIWTDIELKQVKDFEATLPACYKKLNPPKFNGNNSDEIIQIIDENQDMLIFESFKQMVGGYETFCNAGNKGNGCRLLTPESVSSSSRIQDYAIDKDRKWTFLSWCNDKRTVQTDDCIEFDFIPFGFSKGHQHLFINDNFSVGTLINANNFLLSSESSTISLSNYLRKISENNLRYNIQVVAKQKDCSYQTIYINHVTLDIISAISKIQNVNLLDKFYFVDSNDRHYDVETILNRIISGKNLDNIIHILLKMKAEDLVKKQESLYLIIQINDVFYKRGDITMNEKLIQAKKTGFAIAGKLEENKLNSYRQKLISAITTNNKTMIFNILIQLQSYVDITIPFLIYLLEDYEENKNLLYMFIASLRKINKNGD